MLVVMVTSYLVTMVTNSSCFEYEVGYQSYFNDDYYQRAQYGLFCEMYSMR